MSKRCGCRDSNSQTAKTLLGDTVALVDDRTDLCRVLIESATTPRSKDEDVTA